MEPARIQDFSPEQKGPAAPPLRLVYPPPSALLHPRAADALVLAASPPEPRPSRRWLRLWKPRT